MINFNAVSHNRARPYFQILHGRGKVRARRVYLNVHSVTGNVVDMWDTALKFFFPVLQITSPDHLVSLFEVMSSS